MNRDPEARFRCLEELGAALLPFATPEVAARWTSEFVSPSLREPLRSAPAVTSVRVVAAKRGSKVPVWGGGAVVAALVALGGLRASSSSARPASVVADAPVHFAPASPIRAVTETTAANDAPAPVPSEAVRLQTTQVTAVVMPPSAPLVAAKAKHRTPPPANGPTASRKPGSETPLDNGAPILDPE